MKYRKKPVVIEAMQISTDLREQGAVLSPHDTSHAQIAGWLLANGFHAFRVVGDQRPFGIAIDTLEGTMTADAGDYIIRGVQGEFYPCKPDIFAATYEPVQENS